MPTVRQRRLAAGIKALREAAALKPEEAAERLGISVSTVRRAEQPGATLPKDDVLRGMLGLYGADHETAANLMKIRYEAKRHQRGWWVPYRDIADHTYLCMEEDATFIRNWENVFVPGLLQTEEYARAIIEGVFPGHPDNPRRVEARVMRRARFNNRAPRFHAIIDEGVLHRKVCSTDVMWQQIATLRAAASRPNITIQIVPLGIGAHPGMAGSFVLFNFDGDPETMVYVESRAGDLIPEDELTRTGINIDWGRIHGAALSPEESAMRFADLLEG
jgi:transcriptional regulator with XRE-family HTH domain